MFEPHTRVTTIAYGAVFAALVAATTTMLTVTIPSTKGYFNLGDMMVYTAAILTGPLVGGLAGGVGSALSDAYLGYYTFAPGTLVIKGLEGLIVGYLFTKRSSPAVTSHWKALTAGISVVLFVLMAMTGSFYFTGGFDFGGDLVAALSGRGTSGIALGVWLLGAGAFSALVAYTGLRSGPEVGWTAVSIVVGGSEMVAGYFVYEVGIGMTVPAALLEVPFNIAQLVFGLVGALFLTTGVAAVFKRPGG
ncbi:MAG TPA: ECF transporter S component [Conexivisphaerales archaeon]|nr:ECF transporter S component [Conexivisphaerales archaeon]